MYEKLIEITEFVGKTLKSVKVSGYYLADRIDFEMREGGIYRMEHLQDCCESVYLNGINGSLDRLIGIPIVSASSKSESGDTNDGTYTNTTFTLATKDASVEINWHGESNGYYGESVDIFRI